MADPRKLRFVFDELKRRNVFRVGGAYLVAAWTLLQVIDVVGPRLGLPEWAVTLVVALTLSGLPVALALAWYYEITPSGVKPARDVPHDQSVTPATGRRLDRAIILLLCVALGFFIADRVFWRVSEDRGGPHSTTLLALDARSIAVVPRLPATNEAPVPLLRGLVAEIGTALGLLPGFRIVTDTQALKSNVVSTLAEQASLLGVRHILEVAWSGVDDERIQLRLVDAARNTAVWQQQIAIADLNPLSAYELVVKEITRRLEEEHLLSAAPAQANPTQSNEAYVMYLRGRDALNESGLLDRGMVAQLFSDAVSLDERFALAHAGLCEALVGEFRFNQDGATFLDAERHCLRAFTLSADAEDVRIALAGLHLESGHADEAEQGYRTVLAVNPSSVRATIGLAESLAQTDPAQAEAAYRAAMTAHPESLRLRLSYGWFLDTQGRYDDLLENDRLTLRLAPNSSGAAANLALTLERLGRSDEARALLEKTLAAEPTANVMTNLGNNYFYAHRFGDAAVQFRGAIEHGGPRCLTQRNLGDALWWAGQRAAAVAAFKAAIVECEQVESIDPRNKDAWSSAAVAYAALGKRDSAVGAVKQLLNGASEDPVAWYHAAVAYARLGLTTQSIECAQKALSLGLPRRTLGADPDLSAAGVDVAAGHPEPNAQADAPASARAHD